MCMFHQRWSTSLEEEAARWVDKCDFTHQEDPAWGENLYRSEFNRTKQALVFTGKRAAAAVPCWQII